jgi:hypothetical protein
MLGAVEGFLYSQSGGTNQQPAIEYMKSGLNWLRRTNTWGTSGGGTGNLTQLQYDWSTDGGATWASIIAAEVRNYSSGGDLISTTGAGGFLARVEALYGRVLANVSNFAAHIAAVGTAVHGLGSIATQAFSAVALTGGAIDGTAIGGTTPAAVTGQTFKGVVVNLGNLSGATVIDWSLGDYFYGTVVGAWTPTWANLPPAGRGQGLTLELTNPGAFAITGTWPSTKWPSGTLPSRTVAGIDLYEFTCRDGVTVRGAQSNKDSR